MELTRKSPLLFQGGDLGEVKKTATQLCGFLHKQKFRNHPYLPYPECIREKAGPAPDITHVILESLKMM